MTDNDIILEGGGRTKVIRRGNVVIRETGPWTPTVHALLKHLEYKNFSGAPLVFDSGFDEQGREILSFIAGDISNGAPWSDEAIIKVGTLLKHLHDATADFIPPPQAIWRPWSGRLLRGSDMVIGHCDFAPWNLVCKDNIPFALIDWENAGPVDRLVEIAQVCWLNIQLCDDDVAERVGLPSAEKRAVQLKLLLDAYELTQQKRESVIEALIEISITDAADQAIEAQVTPDTCDIMPLWGIAWRTRSAAWIVRNKNLLKKHIL